MSRVSSYLRSPSRGRTGGIAGKVETKAPMLRHHHNQHRASVGSSNCPCEKTLKLLAAHGGQHAQYILYHEVDDVFRWSPHDLEQHMQEEEVILGGLTREGKFPSDTYARILREHAVFRAQIKDTGHFDRDELFRHAKMEDEAVQKAGLL